MTEYYKDIKTVSVNREDPRTTFVSHSDREEAILNVTNFDSTPYHLSLNGEWQFYFNEQPSEIPADICTNVDQNEVSWNIITVPGNWERQGYGTAIYTDGNYDFCPLNPNPPYLPSKNPTGVYRLKNVEIPQKWIDEDRDVFIQIGGARGGLYVYINGVEVGYSEDTKNPADFLINKYIKKGNDNVITLLIHKYCTGSYLEDQDMWRLGGIERDVYLYSQPKTHIRDFKVVSTLDESYVNGLFRLNVYVVNHGDKNDINVGFELIENKSKKAVLHGEKNALVDINQEVEVSFDDCKLNDVLKWSAEHPNLYILLITLRKKSDNSVIEIVPFRIGFRREEFLNVKVNDKIEALVLFFNGKPIKYKGVNIHEHNEVTGHYVTDEIRLKDIELLKRHNFNALRFSHYPQCRRFYEMCDEFGFYVYSECNIESHGMGFNSKNTLANKPIWFDAHMDRTKNMYERTKNHACVTFFSLGNEAGNGENFYKTYEYLKQNELNAQNRPVNYEGAWCAENTDMFVPMYLTAQDLESLIGFNAYKGILPCEYSHSMGNSNGNFDLLWKVIYKYPNLLGGFIWDWVDQGFLEVGKGGKKYWAFGGDYGVDQPSNGNNCINGCVNPDRTPHPALAEIKYSQQNIGFECIDASKGIIQITNRFYFTDLNDYEIVCFIKSNEKVVKEINLSSQNEELQSLKPQESFTIDLHSEIKELTPQINTEYFLNFKAFAKTDNQPFIPKGFEVAHYQVQLPINPTPKTVEQTTGPELSINESEETVIISSEKVHFEFSKKEGFVKSFKVDNYEFIKDGFGFQPNFWRGPTDNDYGNGAPKREKQWKKLSHKFTIKKVESKRINNCVLLTIVYDLKEENKFEVNYLLLPNGILKIKAYFNCCYVVEKPVINKKQYYTIPRIGVRFRVPPEMHNVTYFGRGPQENYSDRCSGTEIDLFKTTAEDLYFPYVRPQENGHHIDTRWLAIQCENNSNGLLITADKKFEFNALRNTVEDFDDQDQVNLNYQYHNFGFSEDAKNVLKRQHHIDDIVPRDFVEINIDIIQEGVAGFNSWGDRVLPEFSIYSFKNYSNEFTLIPINNGSEINEKLTHNYEAQKNNIFTNFLNLFH